MTSRTTFTISVDSQGRLTLPAAALIALGIRSGGEIRIDVDETSATLVPAGTAPLPTPERMENAFDGYARQLTASLSPEELQVLMGDGAGDELTFATPALPEDDYEPEPVPMSDDELSFIRGLLSGRD